MSLKMYVAKLQIHTADELGAHIIQKDQPRNSQQGRVGPEPQEGPRLASAEQLRGHVGCQVGNR